MKRTAGKVPRLAEMIHVHVAVERSIRSVVADMHSKNGNGENISAFRLNNKKSSEEIILMTFLLS